MDEEQAILAIKGVCKSFDGAVALDQVTLSIAPGEILVLLGPSGCGKTTLLRTIAGLEQPDAGEITWQGKTLTDVPVHSRGFGMVFQDYALFQHKNVAENITFGLRMQNWTPAAIKSRLAEVSALVGLTGFEERAIDGLSGGEQQRVALARALAPAPQLLLLDEPLGALDRALRERLMVELRLILKRSSNEPAGMTAIYVTHDQAEAFAIADRVAVMSSGRMEQIAPPVQLYRQPATATVARFLGMSNLLPGEIDASAANLVQTSIGNLRSTTAIGEGIGKQVTVLVRPDAGRLATSGNAGRGNHLSGRLINVSFRGRYQIATIEVNDLRLQLELDQAEELPSPGEVLRLTLDPAGIQLLPAS